MTSTKRDASSEIKMGPITQAELESIGLGSTEKIRALGWQEVFLRWIEAYPERLNLNAAYGLVAVEEGVDWRLLSDSQKQRARALVTSLRRQARGSMLR